MEVSLFLKESALLKLNPGSENDEATMLATFDANRSLINEVADRIHSHDRQDFHVLDASDFGVKEKTGDSR